MPRGGVSDIYIKKMLHLDSACIFPPRSWLEFSLTWHARREKETTIRFAFVSFSGHSNRDQRLKQLGCSLAWRETLHLSYNLVLTDDSSRNKSCNTLPYSSYNLEATKTGDLQVFFKLLKKLWRGKIIKLIRKLIVWMGSWQSWGVQRISEEIKWSVHFLLPVKKFIESKWVAREKNDHTSLINVFITMANRNFLFQDSN